MKKILFYILFSAHILVAQTTLLGKSKILGKSNIAPAGGALNCTPTTPGTTNPNLTSLGTTGWIFWTSNIVNTVTMNGGTNPSTYTLVGSGGDTSDDGFADSFSWTNGTPYTSGADTGGRYNDIGATGEGYYITCPAGTATQICTFYGVLLTSASGSNSNFTAHLSDSSASDYSYTFTAPSAANYNTQVACTYNAASNGQTLKMQFVLGSTGAASSNQGIQAVTLAP